MRIGIIGTRGIPNEYGGFEQFAMHFAEFLASKNIDVIVYNSTNHSYKKKTWRGVQICHIYDPENRIGTAGQFIYDLLSILDSRKRNLDVILQLGYTSSSIWSFLFPKTSRIITNMDGLEWKRSKYSNPVKKFLKVAERIAVNNSDALIADSEGIKSYLKSAYNVDSTFIPYGAEQFRDNDSSCLQQFQLTEYDYHLVVARLEPENNVETIIKGHIQAKSNKLVIIGSTNTSHGKYLHQKYGEVVKFLGAVYDADCLNNLRFYSKVYFHGHSVGGTNPSLLEAMACQCLIIAHSNIFNKAVIGDDGYYFESEKDLAELLATSPSKNQELERVKNNSEKIDSVYSYSLIHNKLLELIEKHS